MGFKVFITDPAIEGLSRIVTEIARHNPEAAQRFGTVLLDRAESLRTFPLRGRMVPEKQKPDVREIVVRPYRIVYRVKEAERRVDVLCFWHGSRGVPEWHEIAVKQ